VKTQSVRALKITQERITLLESLVEELLKEEPAEKVVQNKMNALEIEYTEDPVERINRVLACLHPSQVVDLDFEE
jgi:hypothetical protein